MLLWLMTDIAMLRGEWLAMGLGLFFCGMLFCWSLSGLASRRRNDRRKH